MKLKMTFACLWAAGCVMLGALGILGALGMPGASGALHAQPAPAQRPPALPPAEKLAEGWVALFDGETTYGWKIVEGEAVVKDGVLILGGGATAAKIRTTVSLPAGELFTDAGDGQTFTGVTVDSFHIDLATGKKVPDDQQPIVPQPIELTSPAGKQLHLRRVHYRPKGTKSIFNGKDLTGWKEHSGKKKSKFTVTPEGWLNVQDGPGDLQTTGLYRDFLLQLECKSNGKHLNSGIFFRCLPGEYQQGYEVQIRNQWEGEDRTRPVDFGTGAIYRRQPARKVNATDGEWFSLTILANGRHLASWVNGLQVTDWIDDRPENANARQGACLNAGAISIQGHDPTTNLSFRNFRIVAFGQGDKQAGQP